MSGANFAGANLTNSRMQNAVLARASFVSADCEGADFAGADVRWADFRGASLFGATFRTHEAEAIVDTTTKIDAAAPEMLTLEQAEFVRQRAGMTGAGGTAG